MAENWSGIAQELAKEYDNLSGVRYFLVPAPIKSGPEFRPTMVDPDPVECFAIGMKMKSSDANRVEEVVEGKYRIAAHGFGFDVTTDMKFLKGQRSYNISSVEVYEPGGVPIYYTILVSG